MAAQPNPWLRTIALIFFLGGIASAVRTAFGDTVGFTVFWLELAVAAVWLSSARVRGAVRRLAIRLRLI
jgi:hypothetical protein